MDSKLAEFIRKLYGIVESGAEAYGSANRPMSPEHSGMLGGLLMDFSPLGDAKSAYDGVQSAREGDYLGAALGGFGALPMVPNLAGIGHTVWHGSPHLFPPTAKNPLGEFDSSKAKSGEGFNVYGEGTYVADVREVANDYRVTGTNSRFSYDGEPVKDNVTKEAIKLLMEAKGDKQAAAKAAERYAYDNLLIPKINALDQKKIAEGFLYKVDLPNNLVPKFFQSGVPLNKQSKEVQAALKGVPIKNGEIPHQVLKEKGILGVKYPDQFSAEGKSASNNYVVFDPSILNILSRE